MNSRTMNACLAGTLGLLLMTGNVVFAQGKGKDRDERRGRKKSAQGDRGPRNDRGERKRREVSPPGKARRNLPPAGKPQAPARSPIERRLDRKAPPRTTPGSRGVIGGRRNVERRLPARLPPISSRARKTPGSGIRVEDFLGRRRSFRPGAGNRAVIDRRRIQGLQNQLKLGASGNRRFAPRRYNDWQYWFADNYSQYRWYRGHWNGAWRNRWNTRWRSTWRNYPLALVFGLSPWGINRMAYWFGYGGYYNPYYVQPLVIGNTTIDYSQPLVYPTQESSGSEQGLAAFDRARAAFQQRDYKAALQQVDVALQQMPRDAVLHEFRALVLFALGDYKPAAETLNAVLAAGPGMDWPTLRGLYSSVAEYTRHLRLLEKAVDEEPKAAYLHFLLGYHYLTMGHTEAAAKQFQRTVDLAPKDAVSQQLVTMLTGKQPQFEPPPEPGTGKVAANDLLGTWSAKRGDDSFELALSKDRRFVWTHTRDKTKTQIQGVYALEGDTLALEPDAGGVMLGNVDLKGRNRMQFRMVGTDPKDPGLTFTK